MSEIRFGASLSLPVQDCKISTVKKTLEPSAVSYDTIRAAVLLSMHELLRAYAKFPCQFTSAHEGMSILREEVAELEECVRAQDSDELELIGEATQCAAMSMRFLVDVCRLHSAFLDEDSLHVSFNGERTLVRMGEIPLHQIMRVRDETPVAPAEERVGLPAIKSLREWAVDAIKRLTSVVTSVGDRLTPQETLTIANVIDELNKQTAIWLCNSEVGHLWVNDGPQVKRCGRCGAWA